MNRRPFLNTDLLKAAPFPSHRQTFGMQISNYHWLPGRTDVDAPTRVPNARGSMRSERSISHGAKLSQLPLASRSIVAPASLPHQGQGQGQVQVQVQHEPSTVHKPSLHHRRRIRISQISLLLQKLDPALEELVATSTEKMVSVSGPDAVPQWRDLGRLIFSGETQGRRELGKAY